ncbi:metallophosphoesterase family protein [Flavobacterium sp. FlaQc-47]|uniref:metallophosphoesterase family protein n=1 Tax=Flavobacterium sp. FlaQc-47 TaxID=3374180 RepID=UPI003756B12A
MNEKKLRIAIISDLHCHPKRKKEEGIDETYLLADKLRSPSNDHPVESLLKIIREEEITVNITLCPGDFTDKSNLQGLISGWGFSLEISQELKSENIIATVGNHDVDVYLSTSNYSLTNAKGIKRDFPIKSDEQRTIFWEKGCVFVEEDIYRILVINSSHFHYNKEASHDGKISDDAIEYIDDYLKKFNDDKIQIAMSHHPPVPHPNKKLGEDDKIVNGDLLLDLLGKNNFDLFIYGHKHDPFIKNYNTVNGNNKITLFSAGSFSSGANLIFSSVRNAFHIIDVTKKAKICKGEIKTWTFFPNEGWKINYDQNGFAPFAGFGNVKTVDQIYERVSDLIKDKNKLTWSEITDDIEDIKNLIPDDSKKLNELLKSNGLLTDKHIWECPTYIFNSNY